MQSPPEDSDKRNLHSKINLSQCSQLQLLITLCNVLHRVRSQDIRCSQSPNFFYTFFFNCFVYGFFFVIIKKKNLVVVFFLKTRTDPTAGSPTVTLLRLLLPLDNVI